MARPQRCRVIQSYPTQCLFLPEEADAGQSPVILTLDEYETVRLLDYCGLTQEECAVRMAVARTTVTGIYESARKKLAEMLVDGKPMYVTGGNIRLAEEPRYSHLISRKGLNTMRIAATYENGQVFQHFGRTPQFKVYDVENGAVVSSRIVDTGEYGHGALGGFLKGLEVDTLICGGIGGGAQMAMNNAGIRLFAGISGDPDEAVKALLAGTLPEHGEANCDHHGHGEHGCHHA